MRASEEELSPKMQQMEVLPTTQLLDLADSLVLVFRELVIEPAVEGSSSCRWLCAHR